MLESKPEFTKYEIARILGARALQLSMDAPILLKIDKKKLEEINYDVLKIAELEFTNSVLPITVKRPFPQRAEEKIKKISKEEIKKKEDAEKAKEEGEEETDDKKILEKAEKEEVKIKEEGEIMELARPEDEVEETEEIKEEEI